MRCWQLGGFDPIYRAAGDDVDICWRFQDAGYTIGFSPAAVVWHFRRNTVKAYMRPAARLRQGRGAGLFEASVPLQPVRPGEVARPHLRRSLGLAAAVAPAGDLFRRLRPRAVPDDVRAAVLADRVPAAELRVERRRAAARARRRRRRRLVVAADGAAPRHLGHVHQRRAARRRSTSASAASRRARWSRC